MKLKEIGIIKKDEKGLYVQIHAEYQDALIGLDGFSHVQVLWWANQLDALEFRTQYTVEKPYKPAPDVLGIFATRSPMRPNPICATIISVSELKKEDGVIRTWYIDAEEGTPILDIKPYLPCSDRPSHSNAPEWSAVLPDTIEGSATFDWGNYFNF